MHLSFPHPLLVLSGHVENTGDTRSIDTTAGKVLDLYCSNIRVWEKRGAH